MEDTAALPLQSSGSFNWEQLGAFIASVSEQMKDTDLRIKETSQQMKDTDSKIQEIRQETDKSRREFDERLESYRKETDRQIQESRRESEKSRREFDERLEAYRKETDRRIEENTRLIEKSRDEFEKSNKEFRAQLRSITDRFLSQSGHIVEGLMEPSALNLFKDMDFNIVGCWKEMKATNKATNRRMEVDLFYYDTTEAVAVEVKIKCEREDIDHFLEQMSHFKEVFPKYADTKVYAAIAAINYNRSADVYAAEKGLFVIRVSENDVFSLDSANKADRVWF